MESIVISIGGSVLLSEEADIDFLEKLVNLLKKYSESYKIYIVVGGGKTARAYIHRGRELGLDEETLDEIGIAITRVNAKFLSDLVEISNDEIPCSTHDAKSFDEPIVVMGGTTPGHSTDMVGAELAEITHAVRYIIATNVDGVYDKDPNKFSDAKQLKEISIQALITSVRLWGGMFVAIPTAIPAAPLTRRFGTLAGRTTGSCSDSS